MPFSLQTRLGIATVLSLLGDGDVVGEIMQKASHKTRAYYINIKGLPGFVIPSILTTLRKITTS